MCKCGLLYLVSVCKTCFGFWANKNVDISFEEREKSGSMDEIGKLAKISDTPDIVFRCSEILFIN